MKRVRNILVLLLIVSMTACLFAGCESEAEKIEKLAGNWYITIDDTPEEAQALLESLDFFEEEIALVDLHALQYAQVVKFNVDKTYSFALDAEGTKECVREFMQKAFEDMYADRTSLNALYEQDFGSMSEEEFGAFYAYLYEVEDLDTLLDRVANEGYDYDTLCEPWETGTYSIEGNRILCTITGEITEEYLGYKIEEGTLTLTYKDGVEVYSRSR